MSFSIAVIGDYGVGKSTLSSVFANSGVKILEIESRGSTDTLQRSHLEIAAYAEIMTIKQKIQKLQDQHQRVLFEIPPRVFASKHVSEIMDFDFVIYVISALNCREEYLCQHYNWNEKERVELIGKHVKEAHLAYATDIFLNTVSIDRLHWVASKLLKSFEVLKSLT
ncbi:hypothetical protein OAT84_02890 [Gammaproteobacteria bacterium]|nr:hypothetical protein [Gammaproteobacteria bacterium]